MATRSLEDFLSLSYPVELRKSVHGGYLALHPDLDGCLAEGDTADEALTNLTDARELWIETRLSNGYSVPEPEGEEPSGRISLRMAPSLHDQLAKIASRRKISLNLLINTVLAEYAGCASAEEPLREVLAEIRGSLAELRAAMRGAGPAPLSLSEARRPGKLLNKR